MVEKSTSKLENKSQPSAATNKSESVSLFGAKFGGKSKVIFCSAHLEENLIKAQTNSVGH